MPFFFVLTEGTSELLFEKEKMTMALCVIRRIAKGPFKMVSVDVNMFPQLDCVKAGDMVNSMIMFLQRL